MNVNRPPLSAASSAVEFLEGRIDLATYNAVEEAELMVMFGPTSLEPVEVRTDVAVEALRSVEAQYEHQEADSVPVSALVQSLHDALRLDEPEVPVH